MVVAVALVGEEAGVGDGAVVDSVSGAVLAADLFAGSVSGAVVASVSVEVPHPVSESVADAVSVRVSVLRAAEPMLAADADAAAVDAAGSVFVGGSVSSSVFGVGFFGVRSHSPVSGFCTASPSFS
ncbi:hypothetical protein, partial [Rhodococcus sp. EPR-279]|uniref:hypothetical protein n=1 Tax=Rhodococcus sp. EPR-279 TaxID=1813678 RepID=UPI001E5B7D92